MKLKLFAVFLVLVLGSSGCKPKPAANAAVGYWEGSIALPGMDLKVNVDLSRDAAGVWAGKIGIPAQGIRAAGLQSVTVSEEGVRFVIPGVPGDPTFAGKLAPDGNTISGDFTQGGQKLTFKLERKPRPAVSKIAETPEEGIPGKGLAGAWQGSLKISVAELRLVLEITNTANKLEGTLISVDQGNARVPLTTLEEDAGVHFEAPSIKGSFFGDMSTNGAEISGQWNQLGRTTPMVFKRLAKTPVDK